MKVKVFVPNKKLIAILFDLKYLRFGGLKCKNNLKQISNVNYY